MQSVEEYIHQFPEEVQQRLYLIQKCIKELVPNVEESIQYKMPAYKLANKPFIYFAAFKNHIGLYATPKAHEYFSKELANYKQGKGSVQFPLDLPLPIDLIKKIVLYKLNS